MKQGRWWVGAALLALAGCAAAGTGAGRSQTVITQAEIEAASQLNALELIEVERPHWLRIRGSTSFSDEPMIVVYLDGTRLGDPESLAQISTQDITEIRYYDSGQAQFKFGVGHVHGAIEVLTRP